MRAIDANMTNGDFAFFTYYPLQAPNTDRPWIYYGRYVKDPLDRQRYRQSYIVVKQVFARPRL